MTITIKIDKAVFFWGVFVVSLTAFALMVLREPRETATKREAESVPQPRRERNIPTVTSTPQGQKLRKLDDVGAVEGETTQALQQIILQQQAVERQVHLQVATAKPLQLVRGTTHTFTARAYDESGKEIIFTPQWRVEGGSLEVLDNRQVRFSADENVDTARVICIDPKSQQRTIARIEIVAPQRESQEKVAKAEPVVAVEPVKKVDNTVPEHQSILTTIAISGPDHPLQSGQQYHFNARGYDQFRESCSLQPIWDAEGGGISADGVFTAGPFPGKFRIMVQDRETQRRQEMWIEIEQQLKQIKIYGPAEPLKTGETFQFRAQGFNQADQPMVFYGRWHAWGGNINQQGLYQAGPKPGKYYVLLRDLATNHRAKIYFEIIPRLQIKTFSLTDSDYFYDNDKAIVKVDGMEISVFSNNDGHYNYEVRYSCHVYERHRYRWGYRLYFYCQGRRFSVDLDLHKKPPGTHEIYENGYSRLIDEYFAKIDGVRKKQIHWKR